MNEIESVIGLMQMTKLKIFFQKENQILSLQKIVPSKSIFYIFRFKKKKFVNSYYCFTILKKKKMD